MRNCDIELPGVVEGPVGGAGCGAEVWAGGAGGFDAGVAAGFEDAGGGAGGFDEAAGGAGGFAAAAGMGVCKKNGRQREF